MSLHDLRHASLAIPAYGIYLHDELRQTGIIYWQTHVHGAVIEWTCRNVIQVNYRQMASSAKRLDSHGSADYRKIAGQILGVAVTLSCTRAVLVVDVNTCRHSIDMTYLGAYDREHLSVNSHAFARWRRLQLGDSCIDSSCYRRVRKCSMMKLIIRYWK
jgi:hypothetical protein